MTNFVSNTINDVKYQFQNMTWWRLAVIFTTALAGVFVINFNWQSWLYIGQYIARSIEYTPGLLWLMQVPFVGGFIQGLAGNPGAFCGILLWGVCQLAQSRIIYLAFNDREEMDKGLWWLLLATYAFEVLINFIHEPFYGDSLGDVLRDMPRFDTYLFDFGAFAVFAAKILAVEAFINLSTRLFNVKIQPYR